MTVVVFLLKGLRHGGADPATGAPIPARGAMTVVFFLLEGLRHGGADPARGAWTGGGLRWWVGQGPAAGFGGRRAVAVRW
ncbi:hypothetical protein ACP70R_043173 [Stipagrostis hirtigluma subsp. patula]